MSQIKKENSLNSKIVTEVIKMNQYFTVIIKKEEDWYITECPEIGTVDLWKSVEKAVSNLKEANERYLEVNSSLS